MPEDDRRGLIPPGGGWFIGLTLGWVLFDQFTKVAVIRHFGQPGSRQTLIPGWLDLTYTLNPGAAFGLLREAAFGRLLFVLIGLGALAALAHWRHAVMALPRPQWVGLALVAGGAAGNLIDRLFRGGEVVDFIGFHIAQIGFVWPDFNVADCGVTCGMFLYVIHGLYWEWRHGTDRAPVEAADTGDRLDEQPTPDAG